MDVLQENTLPLKNCGSKDEASADPWGASFAGSRQRGKRGQFTVGIYSS